MDQAAQRRRQRRELRKLVESMGYGGEYAAKAVRQVDASLPNAAELCFQWIEDNPEEDEEDEFIPLRRQDSKLLPLIQMGFSEDEAAAAMRQTNNDMQEAVVVILSDKTRSLQLAIAEEQDELGGEPVEWPNYAGPRAPPPPEAPPGGGAAAPAPAAAGDQSDEVKRLTAQIVSLQQVVKEYETKYTAIRRQKSRRGSLGGDSAASDVAPPPEDEYDDYSPPLAPEEEEDDSELYAPPSGAEEEEDFDDDDDLVGYDDDDGDGGGDGEFYDDDESVAPPPPPSDHGADAAPPPPPPAGDEDGSAAPPPPRTAAPGAGITYRVRPGSRIIEMSGAGGIAAAHRAAQNIPKRRNRRMVAMIADEKEKERQQGPAVGWENTGNYRSVHIQVRDLLEVEPKLGKTWFSSARVDSASLRTAPAPVEELAAWRGEFFFPLASTTQSFLLALHDGDKGGYIGMATIKVEDLKQPADTKWFRLQARRKSLYDELRSRAKLTSEIQVSVRFRPGGVSPGENERAGNSTGRPHAAKKKRSRRHGKHGAAGLRFQEDGYDLNLSYITDRVIAMAYPGTTSTGVVGNRTRSVQDFFEARHMGRYRVFNLCAEGGSCDPAVSFRGSVADVPMAPRGAPRFQDTVTCCKQMGDWIKGHPQSVAAVHCSDGQQRTAVVVCCYLIYSGEVGTAEAAINLFAAMRSADGHSGLEPSNVRAVQSFDAFFHGGKGGRPRSDAGLARALSVPSPRVEIESLKVSPIPFDVRAEGTKVWFVLTTPGDTSFKFSSRKRLQPERDLRKDSILFRVPEKERAASAFSSDFSVTLFYGSTMFKKPLASFSANTRFLKRSGDAWAMLTLGKDGMEGAAADRSCKHFSDDTEVVLLLRVGK